MKTSPALLAVLFAASLLSAQAQPDSNPAGTATSVSPAHKTVGGAAKAAKRPEPEPKIPGLTIPRDNGTFLGLEVVDGNFKLSFYDAKKKPMAADVTRATARWANPRVKGDNRTVLNPSGNALVGSRFVSPPFTFKVYLTLLQGDGAEEKATESFVVDFRG